jgi:ferric-dicitrate binding protein FerR (iron transport regulator)
VRSGKVIAAGHRHPLTLAAGMLAYLTDSTATVATPVDLAQYTDWTQGRLVFDHTPVSTVLSVVGRWYGYQFQLADSTLATERISVVFRVADSNEMLLMLKAVLDASLTFDGHTVTVSKHQAGVRMPARRQDVPHTPTMEMGR